MLILLLSFSIKLPLVCVPVQALYSFLSVIPIVVFHVSCSSSYLICIFQLQLNKMLKYFAGQ